MPNPTLLFDHDTFIDRIQAGTNFEGTNLYLGTIFTGGAKSQDSRTLLRKTIPTEIRAASGTEKDILRLWCIAAGGSGVEVTVYRVDSGGTTAYWDVAVATWVKRTAVADWTTQGGDADAAKHVHYNLFTAQYKWLELDITTLFTDAIDNRNRVLDMLLVLSADPTVNEYNTYSSTEVWTDPVSSSCRPHVICVRAPFGMPMEV